MENRDETPPPVICTLTTKQLAAQKLEWTDLAPLALERSDIEGGVATSYPLALADQIEELASREIECCGSWMNIRHERSANEFRLRITTTNPEGVALIRSLSGDSAD